MKHFFILAVAAFSGAAYFRSNYTLNANYATQARANAIAYKNQFSLGCSANLAAINFEDSANIIPLLNGWGNYRMPVTATNDSAAIYFEQGINMYYGFHIIEALASFEKSVKFDENFAMGYWGKALAYGPNINDFGYAASPDALEAVQKATALSGSCTPVEKALIAAMVVRYSADSTQKREYLNQLYADAMKKVHEDFPQSADAAALYADALMVQHPWDLYDRFYNPKPWTPGIVSILEGLVKEFPDNPGASHYYIHAIEGSQHPERGLEVANRLGSMMPGLAHLVHMPSHIYIRSGYYSKGVAVNKDAVKSYQDYLSKYPPVVNNSFIYIIHNLHMEAACANMDCRYADALQSSEETKNSFDSVLVNEPGYFGYYIQYAYMTPFFTQIRFGKWDDILNSRPIPDSLIYANIVWHYGRGLAFARRHQFNEADAEWKAIQGRMSSPQLQESPPAFNPGIASVVVAEKILQGVIAEEKKEYNDAIARLQEAVDKEAGMLYNEPRDWPHPARQYLGNALLKAGKYADAEKVYKEDLKVNPNNAWSLVGLTEALSKQSKKKEAKQIKQETAKALAGSDTKIAASVF